MEYEIGKVYEFPDKTGRFMGGGRWEPVESPAPAKPEPDPVDMALGSARSFLGGLTFNLADEIGLGAAAGVAGLADWKDPREIYRGMRSAYDAEQGQFEEDNPLLAPGLGLAGGLASGGLGAGKMVARQLARKAAGISRGKAAAATAAETVGLGAGLGAVGGAGAGVGMEDRLQGAQEGAAWGGGLSGLSAAALPVLRGMGRIISPTKRAEGKVRRAIPGEAQVTGAEQTLAEAGGEAGEDLIQGIVTNPGTGRDKAKAILDARQDTQHQRVSKLITDIRGKSPNAYLDELNDLFVARGNDAGVQFGEAFKNSSVNNQDPFLKRLMDVKPGKVRTAWNKAQELADIDPDRTPLPEVFKFDEAGDIIGLERVPDLEAWHHIRLGLKGKSEQGASYLPGGEMKMTPEGRAYYKLHNALRGNLFDQSPDYRNAMKNFATYSQQIDAAKDGRKFYTGKSDEVARTIKNLSVPEREAYTMGMVRGMQDLAEMADDKQNSARRVLKSRKVRQMIEGVLGREKGAEVIKGLDQESLYSTGRQTIMGGSQTAQRAAAMRGMVPGDGVLSSVTGSDLIDRALYRPKRAAAADLLLQQGPAAQSTLRALHSPAVTRANPILGILSGLAGGNLSQEEF